MWKKTVHKCNVTSVFILQYSLTLIFPGYSWGIVCCCTSQPANTTASVEFCSNTAISGFSVFSFRNNDESLRCNTEGSMTLSDKPGPSLSLTHKDYSLRVYTGEERGRGWEEGTDYSDSFSVSTTNNLQFLLVCMHKSVAAFACYHCYRPIELLSSIVLD